MVARLDHRRSAVASAIVAVQRQAYRSEAELIGYDRMPPLLEDDAAVAALDLTLLGVHDDGRLVGLLGYSVDGEVVDIDRLAVAPTHTRRGIATRLLEALHDRHPTRVRFDVSTGAANAPALALYERLGYQRAASKHVDGVEIVHLWRSAPIGVAKALGRVATGRLELAPVHETPVGELAALFAIPEVWEYPYGRGLDVDETADFLVATAAHWERERFGLWSVRLLEDRELVGYAGLSVPTFLPSVLPAVEVGWRFAPASWGRGYATEAASAAIEAGFSTLGLSEIVSVPQTDNIRSVAVCERLGMELDDTVEIPATDRRGAVRGSLYRLSPTR